MAKNNCIIIGISILEKKGSNLDLFYAWWNFAEDKKGNLIMASKEESLVYLESDFILENKENLFVDLSFRVRD